MHLRLLSFLFNDICLTFIINGFSGTIKSTNIWLPSNWQNQQQQIKFASKRTLKCPRHKNPSNSKLPHSNQYSFLSIQCRINYINFCTLESHLSNKPKPFAFLSIAFITKIVASNASSKMLQCTYAAQQTTQFNIIEMNARTFTEGQPLHSLQKW